MAASAEAQRLADQLAIRDLIDRTSDAINHHEWSTVVSLLTPEVIWEKLPPNPFKLQGRDAVQAFLTHGTARVEVLRYSISAPAIEVRGPDRATARSTLSELLFLKDRGTTLHLVGTYSDEFVKQSGQWLFAKRTFRPRYEEDVATPRVFDSAASPESILDAPRK